MSELIFVRHGQASFGQKSYDKLSDLGIEQVRILALHLQSLGEEFDYIYCGSLLRQQETARELMTLIKGKPEKANTLLLIYCALNDQNYLIFSTWRSINSSTVEETLSVLE